MFKHAFVFTAGMALAPVPDAMAEQYTQNGSGLCKSALPVFDGNIRNRPLAIANEGTALAFVSCSALANVSHTTSFAAVWLHNRTAATVSISCTLVAGIALNPSYFTKTVSFPAGSGGYLAFDTSDNGGFNLKAQTNFSCGLPPGTEIQFVSFVDPQNL